MMGYESKVCIVDKTKALNEEKCYAQVIAMFDLCKMENFYKIFKKDTDCFIYADDGETEIVKDCYDSPIKEASINDVIDYLEDFKNTQEYYRRINPLLQMLKGFNPADWRNLAVLHYGH